METAQVQPKKSKKVDAVSLSLFGQGISARYRRTSSALAALEQHLPDMPELVEIVVERVPLEQHLNAMTAVSGPKLERTLKDLDEQVRAFERALERLDRKIPMTWFRKYCQIDGENARRFADYAAMLARNLTGPEDALRLDRVQLIVTRLVESLLPRAAATASQRRALVTEALPRSGLDEGVITQAVTFLNEAENRLEHFGHLDDLLASDFFLETRGFKLALREKVLEPRIMAAAIELNDSVDETVKRLARADAPDGDVKAQLAIADQKLKELFSRLRADESSTEKSFEALQARRASWKQKKDEQQAAVERAERKKLERDQWKPAKPRRWPWALVVVALAGLLVWRMPRAADTRDLSHDELSALSSLVTSGSVSPKKSPIVLMGSIDSGAWMNLGPTGRNQAAADLAQSMGEKGITDATVFDQERPVIQIRRGEVLFVR